MSTGRAVLLRGVYGTGNLSDLWWMGLGRCAEADPEAWFPEKGGSTRLPKQVCAGCEVQRQCLQYALKHDIRFGVWGGTSELERRKMRRGISQHGVAA